MLAWIAKFLLEQVLNRLFAFIAALAKKLARRKEIQKEADASVQPLKDAKTPEEIDDATRDALDNW